MRNEDRINRNLVWPPPAGEVLDLDLLFSRDPTQNQVRNVFIKCIPVQLGRWINHITHSIINWEECCLREYDHARKKFCCFCFIPYFLYLWEIENPSSPLPTLVEKIRNSKWTIPVRVWNDAKPRLLTHQFSKTITLPP